MSYKIVIMHDISVKNSSFSKIETYINPSRHALY